MRNGNHANIPSKSGNNIVQVRQIDYFCIGPQWLYKKANAAQTLLTTKSIRYYFAFSQEPRKLNWNNKHGNNM